MNVPHEKLRGDTALPPSPALHWRRSAGPLDSRALPHHGAGPQYQRPGVWPSHNSLPLPSLLPYSEGTPA